MNNLKFRWHNGREFIYSFNDKGKSILGWFFCQVKDYNDVEQFAFEVNGVDAYENDIIDLWTYDDVLLCDVVVRKIDHEVLLMVDDGFINIDDVRSITVE